MRFDAAAEFKAAVFDEIKAKMPDGSWVDLSDVPGKAAAVEATLGAMGSGGVLSASEDPRAPS